MCILLFGILACNNNWYLDIFEPDLIIISGRELCLFRYQNSTILCFELARSYRLFRHIHCKVTYWHETKTANNFWVAILHISRCWSALITISVSTVALIICERELRWVYCKAISRDARSVRKRPRLQFNFCLWIELCIPYIVTGTALTISIWRLSKGGGGKSGGPLV